MRAEARLQPPVAAPKALQPILKHKKLTGQALTTIHRVVDDDDALRERVARAADEQLVGRAGWLWLERPEGWEDELADLMARRAAGHEQIERERAERDALKRLDAAEQARLRAEAEAAALQAALAAERKRSDGLAAEVPRLKRKVDQLEAELRGARRKAEAADAAVATAQREAREAVAAHAGVVAELEAAQAELAEAAARPMAAELVAPAGPLPNQAAAGALARAADATRAAAEALSAAAAAFAPTAAGGEEQRHDSETPARKTRTPAPRRKPMPVPFGRLAGSVEAATEWLTAPGVLLLVDGYNVAKLAWPELSLPEQRSRLLDRLDGLVISLGTATRVVFDGADVDPLPKARRQALVDFSPAGVKADEVIVAAVGAEPVTRPVVVATNDQAVREACHRQGANLVSSDQLLAVIRSCC